MWSHCVGPKERWLPEVLNAVSKFESYPMPRIDKLLERVGRARFITTLDLSKGY